MADNTEQRHGQDRSRVAGDQEHEVKYIAKKMGVSEEEVKKAIEEVGNDRTRIEQYLTDNGKA